MWGDSLIEGHIAGEDITGRVSMAKTLISIAHPEFREWLTREAIETGLIRAK